MFTGAAVQARLTMKALFGLPLRRTAGMVAPFPELAGLDRPVWDFSTLCHRRDGLTVVISDRQGAAALHLLIDSTGIKAEGEWLAKRHRPSKPRQWCKVHLGIGADSPDFRAVEVTESRGGVATLLPDMVDQFPADQPIGKVGEDGAYDPGAVALSLPNAMPAPSFRPVAMAFHGQRGSLCAARRLGRKIRPRCRGYHRRSLFETKMRCLMLLGEWFMASDFNMQVAELRVRVTIPNHFTALGTPRA